MDTLYFDPSVLEKRAVRIELDPRYKSSVTTPVNRKVTLFPEDENKLHKKLKIKESSKKTVNPQLNNRSISDRNDSAIRKPSSSNVNRKPPATSSSYSNGGNNNSSNKYSSKPIIDKNSAIWTTPFKKKDDGYRDDNSNKAPSPSYPAKVPIVLNNKIIPQSNISPNMTSKSSSPTTITQSTSSFTKGRTLDERIEDRKVISQNQYQPKLVTKKNVDTLQNAFSTSGISPTSLRLDNNISSSLNRNHSISKPTTSLPNGRQNKPSADPKKSWYLVGNNGNSSGTNTNKSTTTNTSNNINRSISKPNTTITNKSSSISNNRNTNKRTDNYDDDIFGDNIFGDNYNIKHQQQQTITNKQNPTTTNNSNNIKSKIGQKTPPTQNNNINQNGVKKGVKRNRDESDEEYSDDDEDDRYRRTSDYLYSDEDDDDSEDEDEYDSDDDFIVDDKKYRNKSTHIELQAELDRIRGRRYNRNDFRDDHIDDRYMESKYSDLVREEQRSSIVARTEDRIEQEKEERKRKEKEELRKKALQKEKRK